MNDSVVVALLSLIGTLGGSLFGVLASSRLVNYRLEQLEKRVEKHNSIVERTFRLEEQISNMKKVIYEKE